MQVPKNRLFDVIDHDDHDGDHDNHDDDHVDNNVHNHVDDHIDKDKHTCVCISPVIYLTTTNCESNTFPGNIIVIIVIIVIMIIIVVMRKDEQHYCNYDYNDHYDCNDDYNDYYDRNDVDQGFCWLNLRLLTIVAKYSSSILMNAMNNNYDDFFYK